MVLSKLLHRIKKSYIYDVLKGHGLEEEEYQELQGQRLKVLVKHAYENVDLYRQKYDEVGVKPEDIKSVQDIHKLPIITRDDLRANFPYGILAKNIDARDCFIVSSTGTTGKPVKIYHKVYKKSDLLRYIQRFLLPQPKRFRTLANKRIRRKTLAIIPMDEECATYANLKQLQRMPSFLRGELNIVNALDDPQTHIQALYTYQPDILISCPSVLRTIVIFSRQHRLAITQPKLLVIGGELMDEHTRKSISDTFNGEVIEQYGATEAGLIALGGSKHDGLHISCRSVVLEVLKDGKPVPAGVPGQVVVTDLWNMASPIIRYSGLNDIVVLSDNKCSCGNKLPLLQVIEGRIVDSFFLPDKRIINPSRLMFVLERIPHIAYFQLIQEEIDKVRILIVEERQGFQEASSPFKPGGPLWNIIMDNFKKLLGDDIHITIDLARDIPRQPGSRFYDVVRSKVEKPRYYEPT